MLRTRERAVILPAVQSLRLLVRRGLLRPFRAWCVWLWVSWGDAPGWYTLSLWDKWMKERRRLRGEGKWGGGVGGGGGGVG